MDRVISPAGMIALSAALLMTASKPAAANPPALRTALEVDGTCPSQRQVEAAFVGEEIEIVSGIAGWRVTITSSLDGTASVEIAHSGTQYPRLRRTLTSADCEAVADTFALIAEAHLRAIPAPTVAPVRAASPAPSPTSAPSTVPALRKLSPQRPLHRQLSVGISAGVDSGMSPEMSMSFAQLDLAATIGEHYRARAALAVDRATAYASDDATLMRQQSSLRVEVGPRRPRSRLWLEPMIGLGVVVSTVEADGLASDLGVRRIHPTATAALLGGLTIGAGVSLRAELGGQLYPIADTYVSLNQKTLGKSPRATIGVGLGMQIDRDW